MVLLSYFLLSQRVVLEGLIGLSRIDGRRKYVVEPELSGEHVLHDTHGMIGLVRIGVPVQNIFQASASDVGTCIQMPTNVTKAESHLALCIDGGTRIEHSVAYEVDRAGAITNFAAALRMTVRS